MAASIQLELQRAIRLNNEATREIHNNGNYDSAIKLLASALALSRQAILEKPDKEQMLEEGSIFGQHSNISLDQCILLAQQGQPPLKLDSDNGNYLNHHLLPSEGQGQGQGPSFVFQSPIAIPEHFMDNADQMYVSSIAVSVMIIFNLALAHQLSGMATSISSMKVASLRKAVKLYELSFHLLREEQMDEGTTVFSMATINNSGVIYYSLGDAATSGRCFEHVLSTLMFLIDCGECDRVSRLEGLFQNTSYLIFPHEATAAAA